MSVLSEKELVAREFGKFIGTKPYLWGDLSSDDEEEPEDQGITVDGDFDQTPSRFEEEEKKEAEEFKRNTYLRGFSLVQIRRTAVIGGPSNPAAVNLLDYEKPEKWRDDIVRAAIEYEEVPTQKVLLEAGQPFFCVEVPLAGAENVLLFGEMAARLAAMIGRPKFIESELLELKNTYVYIRFPEQEFQWASKVAKKLGMDFEEILDKAERAKPWTNEWEVVSAKIFDIGKRMTQYNREPWEDGKCESFDYFEQLWYIRELTVGIFSIRDVGRLGGKAREACKEIEEMWNSNFFLERRLFTKELKALIDSWYKKFEISFPLNQIAEARASHIARSQLRDLSTVLSRTKMDFVSDEEKRAEGISPILKNVKPLSKAALKILEYFGITHEEMVDRLWINLLAGYDVDLEAGFNVEGVVEAFKKENVKGPTPRLNSESGSTNLSTRAEGGKNAILGKLLEDAVIRGLLAKNILLGNPTQMMNRLRGKSYGDQMTILRAAKQEIVEYLLTAAQEASPDECQVYVEMMIVSPDGKLRYTALAERSWSLFSLTSFLSERLEPYSAFRGKGKTDLAENWSRSLNELTRDHCLIIAAEMDRSNATFQARRVIISSLLKCIKKLFPNIDPLCFAGWIRQLNETVVVKRLDGEEKKPLESVDVDNYLETGEEKQKNPKFLENLDVAVRTLKEFTKETLHGKGKLATYLSTIDVLGTAFSSCASGAIATVKVQAGAGKTMSTLMLLAIMMAETEGEDEEVRVILTTRDSINSSARSLGWELPLIEFGEEDTGEQASIAPGGVWDKLESFMMKKGKYLPGVGFWHRWVTKGSRRGAIVVTTPSSDQAAMIAGRKEARFKVIDEVNFNLSCLAANMDQGFPIICMSATPPRFFFRESFIFTPENTFPSHHPVEVSNLGQTIAGLNTMTFKGGAKVVFMTNSIAQAKECEAAVKGAFVPDPEKNPGLSVRIIFTHGVLTENAQLLAEEAFDHEILVLVTTTQINRSDGVVDLIIFPNATRVVMQTATGSDQIAQMEISKDSIHQNANRAHRKRNGYVFDASMKEVSAMMFGIKHRTSEARVCEEDFFSIGAYCKLFKNKPERSPFFLTQWQSRMADYGYSRGFVAEPEEGSRLFLWYKMFKGLRQVSSEGAFDIDILRRWTGPEASPVEVLMELALQSTGEDWEDLRKSVFKIAKDDESLMETMLDLLFEEPIDEIEREELAELFPGKVCCLERGILRNIVGNEDVAASKPPSDGWWIRLPGFRNEYWLEIKERGFVDPPRVFRPRNAVTEYPLVDEAGRWAYNLCPLEVEGKTTYEKIVFSEEREWTKYPERFQKVTVQREGWFLSESHSARLLDSIMNMTTVLMKKVFGEPRLLEELSELFIEERGHEGDWEEVNNELISDIMGAIQDLLGGEINRTKSEFTVVKSVLDIEDASRETVVINPSTGDDSATVIAISHSVDLFSRVRRESRALSLTLGKQLISMEFSSSGWEVIKEGRAIPRITRAIVCCTSSTLPYAPMVDKSQPHPLMVIENNAGAQLLPFWELVSEACDIHFPHVDTSTFWVMTGLVPRDEIIKRFMEAPVDVGSLKTYGGGIRDPSRDRREERIEMIEKNLKMVKSNSKARAAWVTHVEGMLCENFIHPPVRTTRKEVNYLTMNAVARTYKAKVECFEKEYWVPADFLTEYADREGAVLGEKSVSLSPLTVLLSRSGRNEDAILRIIMETDLTAEMADVVIHIGSH